MALQFSEFVSDGAPNMGESMAAGTSYETLHAKYQDINLGLESLLPKKNVTLSDQVTRNETLETDTVFSLRMLPLVKDTTFIDEAVFFMRYYQSAIGSKAMRDLRFDNFKEKHADLFKQEFGVHAILSEFTVAASKNFEDDCVLSAKQIIESRLDQKIPQTDIPTVDEIASLPPKNKDD